MEFTTLIKKEEFPCTDCISLPICKSTANLYIYKNLPLSGYVKLRCKCSTLHRFSKLHDDNGYQFLPVMNEILWLIRNA